MFKNRLQLVIELKNKMRGVWANKLSRHIVFCSLALLMRVSTKALLQYFSQYRLMLYFVLNLHMPCRIIGVALSSVLIELLDLGPGSVGV